MTSYILDASVAAKWFLPAAQEPLAIEAQRILKEYATGETDFAVPDLFWPELGNIYWKAVWQGRIHAAQATAALTAMSKHRIPTHPTEPLLDGALALAISHDRPVYDCIYLALAILTRKSLLTADERLANALAARFPIRWLGSIS